MADRLAALLESTTFNGIDFVEIANDAQTALVVHFVNAVTVQGSLVGANPVTITGGETVASVPVDQISEPADWSVDEDGRPLLTLTTPFPGDFSSYTLAIASPVLDPYYAATAFQLQGAVPVRHRLRGAMFGLPAGPGRESADRPPGEGLRVVQARTARLQRGRLSGLARAVRGGSRHHPGRALRGRRRRPQLPAGPHRRRGDAGHRDAAAIGRPPCAARRLRAAPRDIGTGARPGRCLIGSASRRRDADRPCRGLGARRLRDRRRPDRSRDR